MAKKANLEYFRAKGLLPFQAEFAAGFVEGEDRPYWQLIAPAGTGKTRTAVALIAHEMEDVSNKRFLIIAPYAVLDDWQLELSLWPSLSTSQAPTPLIVDRKKYLELESHVPVGESPWSSPAIILMSIDLAKRNDIVASISSVTWDLVVFDESHLLTGKRKAIYDTLTKSGAARRALLLTSSSQHLLGDVVRKVNYQDVVDWNWRPLYAPFERKLTPIYYNRTKEEHAFLAELQEFAERLSYGKLILRTASSSIYTTERMLRRLHEAWRFLRNKIAHDVPWTDEDIEKVHRQLSLVVDQPDTFEEMPSSLAIQPEEFLAACDKLESLLDRIDEITTDSKLDALISHVKEFIVAKDKFYLCVWSSFANTVQYLRESMREIAVPVYLLTGALEPIERLNSLKAFRENGGILIATDAASEGTTLEYVDQCISYDLPPNMDAFEQRWGRFLRIGQKPEFRMVVLIDQSRSLRWEGELIENIPFSG